MEKLLKNKPIGFPTDRGPNRSYSNLFYWAHATAKLDSTIGLHPHRGFEILTYVLSGSIKHYDTLIDKWIKLDKGDACYTIRFRNISFRIYTKE